VTVPAAGTDRPPSDAFSAGGHADTDLFVWPPTTAPDDPITLDVPAEPGPDARVEASGDPSPGALAAALGAIEEDLLGVRSVSFARWARATGWTPDGFGAFCWRCAESVGPFECDGAGCGSCREKRLAWDRALRLGVYNAGLRSCVTELKFGRWRRTGADLGRFMGRRLAESMAAGGFAPSEVVLVPVPSSWRRRMQRGVDHTGVLAKAAGAEAGVRLLAGLVRRHTPPQVGLSATARAANIRGAFRPGPALARLTPSGPAAGAARRSGVRAAPGRVRAVVVLDDVRTTGATMSAACRAVRGSVGRTVEIWSLVAAVASQRRPGGGFDRR
jgi:predicted amidophosphoribosyltransferase